MFRPLDACSAIRSLCFILHINTLLFLPHWLFLSQSSSDHFMANLCGIYNAAKIVCLYLLIYSFESHSTYCFTSLCLRALSSFSAPRSDFEICEGANYNLLGFEMWSVSAVFTHSQLCFWVCVAARGWERDVSFHPVVHYSDVMCQWQPNLTQNFVRFGLKLMTVECFDFEFFQWVSALC